jgi:hypothetical protein
MQLSIKRSIGFGIGLCIVSLLYVTCVTFMVLGFNEHRSVKGESTTRQYMSVGVGCGLCAFIFIAALLIQYREQLPITGIKST